jgi:hypothetical protein
VRLRPVAGVYTYVLTIFKHFVILSAPSKSPLNDNIRRRITYANLEPFKRRRMQRPRPS